MKRIAVLFILCSTLAVAKDKKEKISVHILNSASEAVVAGHVTGTNAYTTTSCGISGTTNVNATATDTGGGTTSASGTASTQGSTNCATVYHEATPGHDTYVTHVLMDARVPALNNKEVFLWCAVQWRQCAALPEGTYDAEIQDDIVWIYAFGGARASKIKYRIVNPALFGLPKNSEYAPEEVRSSSSLAPCSLANSTTQCQEVAECEHRGGTRPYCQMMYESQQPPH